jgi:alpha-ribazole phosphatase
MQIYLIRHPPPQLTDSQCYGRLDVPVTQAALAATAASVLAQIPPLLLKHAPVYSSPAERCMGLARRIAAPREPTPVADLLEMDFGDWQGRTWDAIPRGEMDAWSQDTWDYRPGGGESARMVDARWHRWLKHVRGYGADSVIAVTHAGVIRVALGSLDAAIPFGSVHHLDIEPRGAPPT